MKILVSTLVFILMAGVLTVGTQVPTAKAHKASKHKKNDQCYCVRNYPNDWHFHYCSKNSFGVVDGSTKTKARCNNSATTDENGKNKCGSGGYRKCP